MSGGGLAKYYLHSPTVKKNNEHTLIIASISAMHIGLLNKKFLPLSYTSLRRIVVC